MKVKFINTSTKGNLNFSFLPFVVYQSELTNDCMKNNFKTECSVVIHWIFWGIVFEWENKKL